MALYAFDGTWNEEDPTLLEETNVIRFRDCYRGRREYVGGVGSRFGALGAVLGGIFGAGGQTRIEEMYDLLVANWKNGDEVIDVIGFSRGAALAIHFTNVIAQEGLRDGDDQLARPEVRFLGLWDTVGAFGIPIDIVLDFQSINIGYDLRVGDGVRHCRHAMALHERRHAFAVERQDIGGRRRNIEELWFRGHHNDIGGGLGNPALSSIPLQWMLEQGRACGLPIDKADIAALDRLADRTAPIGWAVEFVETAPRRVQPGDRLHPAAESRKLAVGEKARFRVRAAERFNWSGLRLVAGGHYAFTVARGQTWTDRDIVCGPAGWRSEALPWLKERAAKAVESRRRCPDANWFELIGAIGENDKRLFRIGRGGAEASYRAPASGDLYAFANDLSALYGNNSGELEVTVKRLAGPARRKLAGCRRG